MTETIPIPKLSVWLRDKISEAHSHPVVIIAGHYGIYSSGSWPIEVLDPDESPEPSLADFASFSRLTWEAACRAVAESPARKAQLLVLVDDFQFVQPVTGNRSVGDRLAWELAVQYMAARSELPPYHAQVMKQSDLDPSAVVRWSDTRWMFSERELRVRLVHRLISAARKGELQEPFKASPDRSTITISDPEYGEYPLVQSGRTNCTGMYLELLTELRTRNVSTVITLLPQRCMGQVGTATVLASRLGVIRGCSVANVAIPDWRLALPAHVVRAP